MNKATEEMYEKLRNNIPLGMEFPWLDKKMICISHYCTNGYDAGWPCVKAMYFDNNGLLHEVEISPPDAVLNIL